MTVCTAEPSLITVPEARVFILKCNTYLKRDPGRGIDRLSPCDENGLYPGQSAPPVDHSDEDPEEELFKLEQELDVPFKHRFYNNTKSTSSGECVSVEPECDT
jgi:hypothetical protein